MPTSCSRSKNYLCTFIFRFNSEKMLEVAFSVILSSVTTLLLMVILINSSTEGFFVSRSKCTVLKDNIILNKPWINIFRVDFTVIVNKVACLSIT